LNHETIEIFEAIRKAVVYANLDDSAVRCNARQSQAHLNTLPDDTAPLTNDAGCLRE